MSLDDLDQDFMESEDPETIVAARGLTVRYGSKTLLDGLDLEVQEGQVYALLGRNGAGKSSLVRCVLGLQPVSGGQVELFGRDAWKHRHRLMGRIGVVPEESDVPPSMTCLQLSRFSSGLYDRWDHVAYQGRLERFGIDLKQSFGKLSRGQKAQVMLALSLASSPRLLVLDDPTLGLDMVARKAVFEDLVDELATRPLTVLITSHDLPGIERLATHIAVLRDGRLAMDEELESVKERYRWIDLVDANDAGAVSELEPVSEQARGRGASVLVGRFEPQTFEALRESLGAHRVSQRVPSLEEILLLQTEPSSAASLGSESAGETRA